jgi:hypothetical protein
MGALRLNETTSQTRDAGRFKMLFYTTLLLTSLIVTLAIIWMYKLIVFLARNVFRGNPHSIGLDSNPRFNQKSPGLKWGSDARPWGGIGHSNPSTVARTHPAVPDQTTPWGWPDHKHADDGYHPTPASLPEESLNTYLSRQSIRPDMLGTWKLNVDRPDRDDRSVFNSKVHQQALKRARKAVSKDMYHKADAKPWGW